MSEVATPTPTPAPELKPGPCGEFLTKLGINITPQADATNGVETFLVAPADLEPAMEKLRTSPETKLNYLVCVSGVEQADSFESVYHLWSYENDKACVVKVRIAKADIPEGKLPVVPSLTKAWPAANWHERESYDLMGIRYAGHPYLRRILNPWDWEGHPLRRDYKQPVDALNDKNPHSMR